MNDRDFDRLVTAREQRDAAERRAKAAEGELAELHATILRLKPVCYPDFPAETEAQFRQRYDEWEAAVKRIQ